jgi:hypothetical protein
MLIITLVFEKNANFSPKIVKNRRKIVIITSTPGHTVTAGTSPIAKFATNGLKQIQGHDQSDTFLSLQHVSEYFFRKSFASPKM